jgi:two-component system nitrogen regulation sensor histidine kinase NtrY
MVDEFSMFARMPAPVRKQENLVEIVEGAVTIQRMGRADIDFVTHVVNQSTPLFCDAQQIEQAMANLLQNAIHAVDASEASRKRIDVRVKAMHDGGWKVLVEDNGRGLPREMLDRLMEPYVTTREKGTGLGLAIVKKIMEDHGGSLELGEVLNGGACVALNFPAEVAIPSESSQTTEPHVIKEA